MDHERAHALALRTGLRAERLGLNLDNKADPDVGELAAACARERRPLHTVMHDK